MFQICFIILSKLGHKERDFCDFSSSLTNHGFFYIDVLGNFTPTAGENHHNTGPAYLKGLFGGQNRRKFFETFKNNIEMQIVSSSKK